MKNILNISTLLLLMVVVIGCGNDEKVNKEGAHGDEHNVEFNTTVVIQQRQLDVMNIELGSVKEISLGSALKVNGQLELPPQKMASVSAIVGGRVQSVAVIEGDYVKKGQVIAELNNPEFIIMQREYIASKSNFSYLENDYLRKKELLKDSITSVRAFQEAEAAYLEAKSILNASKAMLKVIGVHVNAIEKGNIFSSVPVTAPISGYIQNIEINIGKFVAPEQKMFEIVDNEYLHIGLKVFEKDIDKAKIGQKITFALTTKPKKIYEGEIFALGKAFDMNTRAVKVHAQIIGENKGLLPGMFVEARIITANKKVNALPNEAFVSESGLDYIFIQKSKNGENIEFEKVQVNKGVSDLGFSQVVFIEEIKENSIVVLKGAYYLNSEMQKSEFGDEH